MDCLLTVILVDVVFSRFVSFSVASYWHSFELLFSDGEAMWTARRGLVRVALCSTRHVRATAVVRPLSVATSSSQQRRRLHVTATRFYATAERHEFQAETKNLLDIVAKSLYSNSEACSLRNLREKRLWSESGPIVR